jgi:hypothetical protein
MLHGLRSSEQRATFTTNEAETDIDGRRGGELAIDEPVEIGQLWRVRAEQSRVRALNLSHTLSLFLSLTLFLVFSLSLSFFLFFLSQYLHLSPSM